MNQSEGGVSLVPTLITLALAFVLILSSLLSSKLTFQFTVGGPFILWLCLAGVLCLVFQAVRAHRGRAPLWTIALTPGVVVILGSYGVILQMRAVRLAIADELIADPDLRWRAFATHVGETLTLSTFACLLGALTLVHASFLLSLRARSRLPRTPLKLPALLTALAAAASLLAVLFWRVGQQLSASSGAVLTLVILLYALVAFMPGLLALLNSDNAEIQTQQQAWEDVLLAALGAIAAVAFATVAGRLRALSRACEELGGELNPIQKARVLEDGFSLANTEVALGLMGGTLLLMLCFFVLLTRLPAASRNPAGRALILSGATLVSALAPWHQLSQLLKELPEYREGTQGELVLDRTIEPGALLVDLTPLVPGEELSWPAEIRISQGPVKRWTPHNPPKFAGLSTDTPFLVRVEPPYLAQPAGPFILPKNKGAHVSIGVLRLSPPPRPRGEEDHLEPEKVLHIDLSDPSRFRLFWRVGQTVVTVRDTPRSWTTLANAVEEDWKVFGVHKNDRDRKRDAAFLRYVEPGNLDEILQAARSVARTQRLFQGEKGNAFDIFLLATQPANNTTVEEEVRQLTTDSLPPEQAVLRLQNALARCGGDSDSSVRPQDSAIQCGAGTLAGLWSQLGQIQSLQGDTAEAVESFYTARLLNPRVSLPSGSAPRAQEAFGSAQRLPLPTAREGALTVNGRLPPQTLSAVLSSRLGLIRKCHAEGLRSNPRLEGRVAVRFVVGQDGEVSAVGQAGSDLPDKKVVQCVVGTLRGLTFPRPESGIVTVVAPFMLSPK